MSTHTLFVLNLLFDGFDGVGRLHIQSDGFAGQSFDEDLHTRATAQAQHKVQGTLLLNVVIGQSATVLQLLTSEDQALLVRGNTCITQHAAKQRRK
jgi:hypothetical protein